MSLFRKKRPVARRPSADNAAKLDVLLAMVNDKSQPNLNALHLAVRNITLTNMNIKAMGYDLARRLCDVLPERTGTVARHLGLTSKTSVQADIASDWVAHWCGELHVPVVYHRKLWELSYVLQAMFEHGLLVERTRALGFGCGREPIPSYLAAKGVAVLVTDLADEEARSKGWTASNQHVGSLDQAFHAHLVTRERFDALVSHRHVDMNAIPGDLVDYDVCWSICALEHLGSIAKGLDFIANSLKTLRPGGLAVHTLEHNIQAEGPTIDNWGTVLFQRRHIEGIAERLRAQGHTVAALDFDLGSGPLDRFVDVPPWAHDLPAQIGTWLGQPNHLKVSVDGFPCTCFGLIIKKAG